MNRKYIPLHWFVLYIIQIFVLNNIQMGAYLHIQIYILALFLLPYKLKGVPLLIAGFLIGFTMDLLTNTIGIHAAATTALAYIRPRLLGLTMNHEEMENSNRSFDINGFFKYTGISTLLFNMIYFQLEAFSFAHPGTTLLRILCSSVVSWGGIMLYYFAALKSTKD